jgi:hypothetical protein
MLRQRIAAVIIVLVVLALIAVVVELELLPGVGDDRHEELSSLGAPVVPIVIGIVAVLLATWFQQRAAFLESLRRLWSHMIEARVLVNDYLMRPSVTQEDYWHAYRALSRAIDEMRGVYCNVGESDAWIGYYPFEQMHDIRKAFMTLQDGDRSEARITKAQGAIDQAWDSLRPRFLVEFNPPEPTHPTTDRESRDPRRKGSEGRPSPSAGTA